MESFEHRSLADIVQKYKLSPLQQAVSQLNHEVEGRRKILEKNLNALLYREVELSNAMPSYPFPLGLEDRTRQVLEKELTRLKLERNREYETYWRDVVKLKEELREKLGEYGQARTLLGMPEHIQTPPARDIEREVEPLEEMLKEEVLKWFKRLP